MATCGDCGSRNIVSMSIRDGRCGVSAGFYIGFSSSPMLRLMVRHRIRARTFALGRDGGCATGATSTSAVHGRGVGTLIRSFVRGMVSRGCSMTLDFCSSDTVRTLCRCCEGASSDINR